MSFIYIKKSQAMAMHQYLIELQGGIQGLRDEGLLDSALAQPRQSAFGEDLYPDVFSKAAAYAFSLSENQPFIDGNKRVAASVMGSFLIVNGYELTCKQIELYEVVMQLANRKLNKQDLAKWLKKHAKPLKNQK